LAGKTGTETTLTEIKATGTVLVDPFEAKTIGYAFAQRAVEPDGLAALARRPPIRSPRSTLRSCAMR
jgi:hypothetical protein